MYNLKKVCQITDLSGSTIYRSIADGEFPDSVSVSARGKRWRRVDIELWCIDPEGWITKNSTPGPKDQTPAPAP